MESKMFCLVLCFQIAVCIVRSEKTDCTNIYCQHHSELKTFIEDLFRHQEATLVAQQRKIEEYQQQIRNFSDSQANLMVKIGAMGSLFSEVNALDEFHQLLEKYNDSKDALLERIDRMKIESSLQKQLINNLTSLFESQLDENIRYHENKRYEFSNYQETVLNTLQAMESVLSSQRTEKTIQNNNTEVATTATVHQPCGSRTDYIYKPEFEICYKIYPSPQKGTVGSRITECDKDGAELIKINSQEVQDFFAEELGKLQLQSFDYVLIQGNDKLTEGTWKYDDGSLLDYFNWNIAQPDGSSHQDVIGMNRNSQFRWHDLDSGSHSILISVCQIRAM